MFGTEPVTKVLNATVTTTKAVIKPGGVKVVGIAVVNDQTTTSRLRLYDQADTTGTNRVATIPIATDNGMYIPLNLCPLLFEQGLVVDASATVDVAFFVEE
jgi:hypothetical protein